jgi:polyisoprenoid-binding protein YceI
MLKNLSRILVGSQVLVVVSMFGSGAQASVKTGAAISQVSLDANSGNVEFDATGHPSALRIVGKGKAPAGSFDVNHQNVSGKATFDLTSLQTGISMRDEHMKNKYLEVAKYPQAELLITHLQLPANADIAKGDCAVDSVPFEGKLKFHGVEKPVSGTTKLVAKGDKVDINARFGLKVDDYGISQPKFAGITMADEVQVLINSSGKLTRR